MPADPVDPADDHDPLTAKTGFTAAERKLRSEVAARTKWSDPAQREAHRTKARMSLLQRFEKQVDPDGVLPADYRAQLAYNAMRAHMQSMSLKAVRQRRLRRERIEKAKVAKGRKASGGAA